MLDKLAAFAISEARRKAAVGITILVLFNTSRLNVQQERTAALRLITQF
jgi:hypothetical protein